MGNYLNIGNAGFTSAIKGIYIDKTELIAFINSTLGTKDKLTGKGNRRIVNCLSGCKKCRYNSILSRNGIRVVVSVGCGPTVGHMIYSESTPCESGSWKEIYGLERKLNEKGPWH